jgi:hypothetical protein
MVGFLAQNLSIFEQHEDEPFQKGIVVFNPSAIRLCDGT